jgi:hypothetical protein
MGHVRNYGQTGHADDGLSLVHCFIDFQSTYLVS